MPKKDRSIEPLTDGTLDEVAGAIVNKDGKGMTATKRVHTKDGGVLEVQGVEIRVVERENEDYISLTDMTSKFDGEGDNSHINNWLRSKETIEFIGVWERLNNQNFNYVEFDIIRLEAGTNRFRMTVKQWVEKTGGIGLIAKTGRYGGTFAHKDIALEFASWLSPEFKLYIIKEFQRLKQAEVEDSGQLEWNIRRTLAKAHYVAHTDAVKEHLIPDTLSEKEIGYIYASEADLLNKALFGKTAKEWKMENQNTEGNQRDNATTEQLIVLSSLESQNALLIKQGQAQHERLRELNELARRQMQSLLTNPTIKKLQGKPLLLQ
jgi:hypothetical protein